MTIPTARFSRRDALGVCALLGLTAIFFWRALTGRGFFYFGDIEAAFFPLQQFYREALAGDRLPLWSPYLGGGFPAFAEGQMAALYPINFLLAKLASSPTAINYLIAVHIGLAAVFTYLLARRLGVSRSGSLLAGFVFAFSGYFIPRLQHVSELETAAWLPLLLYVLETGFQRRRAWYAAPAALVIGVQGVAGHPQMMFESLVAVALWMIARAIRLRREERPEIARLAVLGLGAVVLGLGLGAVQLLPTARLVSGSARTLLPRLQYLRDFPLMPEHLVTALFPNAFGSPAFGDYHGLTLFWESCAYLGVVPLALAIWSLRRGGPRPLFLLGLALIALFLALAENNPLYLVLQYLPGFNLFRAPARYLLLYSLAVSIMAGWGLDRLRRSRPAPRSWGLAALAATVIVPTAVLYAIPESQRFSLAPLGLAGAAALVAAAVGLIAIGARGLVSPRALGAAALALTVADLWFLEAPLRPMVGPDYYRTPPVVVQQIRRNAGWFRILVWEARPPGSRSAEHRGWAGGEADARVYRESLPWGLPMAYGLRSASGVFTFADPRLGSYLRSLNDSVESGEGVQFSDVRPLQVPGVRFLVSARSVSGPGLFRADRDGVSVYRNTTALPRAFLVDRTITVAGGTAAFASLRRPEFDPANVAIVESPVPLAVAEGEGAVGQVTVESPRPERILVRAFARRPALLVLNERYAPGWEALLDGRPTRLYRADYLLQGVVVPAGTHTAEFRYRAPGLRLGWATTLLSALAVLAVAVTGAWRAARRRR